MSQATGTNSGTAPYTPTGSITPEATRMSMIMPARRAEDPRLRKSRLTLKIFLNGAAIVVAVLGVTLFATWISAQRAADESVQRGLEATRDRVRGLMNEQQARLSSGAQTYVANNIDFRSHLEQLAAQPESLSRADYLDQAQVVSGAVGADWVQIISPNAHLLARSDDSTAYGDSIGSPLVKAALAGDTASGFGVAHDSLLFYAAAVPIYGAGGGQKAGGTPIGVLMAARFVEDSDAVSSGRETGSEVLFYALTRDNRPAIVGTTPALADRNVLRQWVGDRMMKASSSTDSATGREDATINGRHFVGQGSPLLSASGNPVGGFVALRDRDAELGAFRQLRTTILFGAAAGLVLAFILSALVARQVTRPVRALAEATSRAADGDYGAEIPAGGGDEIGALADAFRDLLADLRDKQALVELLQTPNDGAMDGRTVPLAKVTPAMQQVAIGSGPVLEPGQVLANRYEIATVLGVGGMGVVYRANDRQLGDPVAIKTLKPDLIAQDPSALDRFKSEIRLARRISHRNVVRTHDLGEVGGMYYITMELVEGKTLKDLVTARGKLPAAAVLPIAKQLCRALDVAHQAGVIHRDIKPQNMVVEANGVLKVMDFGIARLAERSTGHTQAGMIVGTPQYMAPEQLAGEELDPRADLYAVGCVLYECLTGQLPHQADSLVTLIAKVLEEKPQSPREISPDVPEQLSEIVMHTLAKSRDARPASAEELHDLLAAIG